MAIFDRIAIEGMPPEKTIEGKVSRIIVLLQENLWKACTVRTGIERMNKRTNIGQTLHFVTIMIMMVWTGWAQEERGKEKEIEMETWMKRLASWSIFIVYLLVKSKPWRRNKSFGKSYFFKQIILRFLQLSVRNK